MPRVMVTGSSGQVGRACVELLEATGWTVQRFDLAKGDDLRDADAVHAAARGCTAIVHAGAVAHDTAGTPDEIVATNVLGSWHVLSAAEHHEVVKVVYFSSAQVFGCADGEGCRRRDTASRRGRPHRSRTVDAVRARRVRQLARRPDAWLGSDTNVAAPALN